MTKGMSAATGAVPFALTIALTTAIALTSLGCVSFQGARLYQTGTAALDRGDRASAILQLERAAELVPTASEVHNHLGLAYQADGRSADAELAFRRAVDLDCTNVAAAENLRVVESIRQDRASR